MHTHCKAIFLHVFHGILHIKRITLLLKTAADGHICRLSPPARGTSRGRARHGQLLELDQVVDRVELARPRDIVHKRPQIEPVVVGGIVLQVDRRGQSGSFVSVNRVEKEEPFHFFRHQLRSDQTAADSPFLTKFDKHRYRTAPIYLTKRSMVVK